MNSPLTHTQIPLGVLIPSLSEAQKSRALFIQSVTVVHTLTL